MICVTNMKLSTS